MIDVQGVNQQICRGVAGLADAISGLSKARKLMQGDVPHGLQESIDHLVSAATAIPDTYWGLLLASSHVGPDEIAARLQAAVREGLAE